MDVGQPGYENAFGALRQFVRRKKDVERCELCSAEVGSTPFPPDRTRYPKVAV